MKKMILKMGSEKNQETTLYGRIDRTGANPCAEISEKPGNFDFEISISHGNEEKNAVIAHASRALEMQEILKFEIL